MISYLRIHFLQHRCQVPVCCIDNNCPVILAHSCKRTEGEILADFQGPTGTQELGEVRVSRFIWQLKLLGELKNGETAETWFVYILRCADGSLYTGRVRGTITIPTSTAHPISAMTRDARASSRAA